jgi:hypothetical protein
VFSAPALAYHFRYTTDPESVKALPNGEAWLASRIYA